MLALLNTLHEWGKIKFTMQVGGDERLEFLDLKLKITYGTISLDVFSKRNNSFTYVLPFTCYPKRKINNVPK